MNSLDDKVYAAVCKLVQEETGQTVLIDGNQKLVENLGLRSLALGLLVARLEFELGVDPFARLVPITSVVTVGDLVAAYRSCFAAQDEPGPQAEADGESGRGQKRLSALMGLRQEFRGRRTEGSENGSEG